MCIKTQLIIQKWNLRTRISRLSDQCACALNRKACLLRFYFTVCICIYVCDVQWHCYSLYVIIGSYSMASIYIHIVPQLCLNHFCFCSRKTTEGSSAYREVITPVDLKFTRIKLLTSDIANFVQGHNQDIYQEDQLLNNAIKMQKKKEK